MQIATVFISFSNSTDLSRCIWSCNAQWIFVRIGVALLVHVHVFDAFLCLSLQVCNSSAIGHLMTCLTPDLSALSSLTNHDWPLVASMSFIMDAVGGLVTSRNPVVRYFDDPVVQHFGGSGRVQYLYDDETHLEIKVCFCQLRLDRLIAFTKPWCTCTTITDDIC